MPRGNKFVVVVVKKQLTDAGWKELITWSTKPSDLHVPQEHILNSLLVVASSKSASPYFSPSTIRDTTSQIMPCPHPRSPPTPMSYLPLPASLPAGPMFP